MDGLPLSEFLTAFGYVVLVVIIVAAPIWFLDQL
jgi:preprotein translocase subunit SecE